MKIHVLKLTRQTNVHQNQKIRRQMTTEKVKNEKEGNRNIQKKGDGKYILQDLKPKYLEKRR